MIAARTMGQRTLTPRLNIANAAIPALKSENEPIYYCTESPLDESPKQKETAHAVQNLETLEKDRVIDEDPFLAVSEYTLQLLLQILLIWRMIFFSQPSLKLRAAVSSTFISHEYVALASFPSAHTFL